MSPRAFERPATIAMDGAEGEAGLALEGLYTPVAANPCGGGVIAPPHPLYGGSMDVPVVTEIAHACIKADMASLRFNWRGAGGSGGVLSGESGDADRDTLSALRFLEQSVEGGIVACGYSFGAASALRVGALHRRVRGLLLVAPPSSMLDADRLSTYSGHVFIAVGAEDRVAPPDELRRIVEGAPAATFLVIPDTDHFFQRGLAELGTAAGEWLSTREFSA